MLTNAYKVVTIATKTQIASITTVVFDVFANAVIEVMEEFVMTKMNVKKASDLSRLSCGKTLLKRPIVNTLHKC